MDIKHLDTAVLRSTKGSGFPSLAQWRHAGKVLRGKELGVLFSGLFLAVVGVGLLLTPIVQRHVEVVPAVGGTYTEALVGTPRYINPLLAPLNDVDKDIVRLVFSGLLRRDAEGKLVNDLAAQVEVNETGSEYTVLLREGASWHDGQPVTADDVVFTFTAVQNADFRSPLAARYAGLRVEKMDERTIKFIPATPTLGFRDFLTLGLLPQHIWSRIPPLAFLLADANLQSPVGAGPYRVAEFSLDTRAGAITEYVLQRVPNYAAGPARIEQIHFKFYRDFESALDAVNTKQVEGVSYVPQSMKSDVKNPLTKLTSLSLPQYRAVYFHLGKGGPMAERPVREALLRATRKQVLVDEVFQGDAVLVAGPIPSWVFGYNPAVPVYDENIREAMRLLDEAGWVLPEGGTVRVKTEGETTRPLALTLVAPDSGDFIATAEQLRDMWRAVGAEVTVQTFDAANFVAGVLRPRAFDAVLYDTVLGAEPDPFLYWHSSMSGEAGYNLSNYSNAAVDKSLEESRAAKTREERAAALRAFQVPLMQDLPAVFLVSPSYTYSLAASIQGFNTTLIQEPSDRFANVREWYIKTGYQLK